MKFDSTKELSDNDKKTIETIKEFVPVQTDSLPIDSGIELANVPHKGEKKSENAEGNQCFGYTKIKVRCRHHKTPQSLWCHHHQYQAEEYNLFQVGRKRELTFLPEWWENH